MIPRASLQLPLRPLNDMVHLLESFDEPQMRTRRALQLLERIVPHGGRIWAESAGQGEGATLSFTLPIAGTAPDMAKD